MTSNIEVGIVTEWKRVQEFSEERQEFRKQKYKIFLMVKPRYI